MHLAKNIEIPIVVLLFVVALLGLYSLICGVECCQECRHLRRKYQRLPEPETTTSTNV